jgi:hypothetical protein
MVDQYHSRYSLQFFLTGHRQEPILRMTFEARAGRCLRFPEDFAMRRVVAIALAFSLAGIAPVFAAGRARQAPAQTASLSGTATASNGQTIANTPVQLRDVNTGQLVGKTTSTPTGTFTFAGLGAGTYAVEVLSATGQIIGTSAAVSVAAGATVTGVAVGASAAAAAAGAGACAAAAGAAGAGTAAAAAGVSTAIVVTTVAVAAGIAATVAIVKANASPSR